MFARPMKTKSWFQPRSGRRANSSLVIIANISAALKVDLSH